MKYLNEILINWDNSDNSIISGPIQNLEIPKYPLCITLDTFERNREKIWNILINDWDPLVEKCGLRNYLSNEYDGYADVKTEIFTGWDFSYIDGLEDDVYYIFQTNRGDTFADLDSDSEFIGIIAKKISKYLKLFKNDKKWKFCPDIEKDKDWMYYFYYKTPIENGEYLYLRINTCYKELGNVYCVASLFVKENTENKG